MRMLIEFVKCNIYQSVSHCDFVCICWTPVSVLLQTFVWKSATVSTGLYDLTDTLSDTKLEEPGQRMQPPLNWNVNESLVLMIM